MLELNGVTVTYGGLPVVRDVSFSLGSGEIVCLVGESGSGKSSIIKAIVDILDENGAVSGGSILFNGRDLTELDKKQMRRIRGAEIAMVSQQPELSLDPVTKIGKQFYEAVSSHRKVSKAEAHASAEKHLRELSIQDPARILSAYPFMLSGGTNQRVALAMAMVMQAKLILADEPTSQQDVTVQVQIVESMLRLREKYNTAFLIVTHDMGVVARMADKVGVLYKGSMVEWGSKDEIIYEPAHPYTRALIAAIPTLDVGRSCTISAASCSEGKNGCPYVDMCEEADCGDGSIGFTQISPGHFVRCRKAKEAPNG